MHVHIFLLFNRLPFYACCLPVGVGPRKREPVYAPLGGSTKAQNTNTDAESNSRTHKNTHTHTLAYTHTQCEKGNHRSSNLTAVQVDS